MFLTETRLRARGDDAKCSDLTPAGYSIRSFPPTRPPSPLTTFPSNSPVSLYLWPSKPSAFVFTVPRLAARTSRLTLCSLISSTAYNTTWLLHRPWQLQRALWQPPEPNLFHSDGSPQKSAPWFSGVAEEFRSLKQQRRRSKRLWLKTGLTFHTQLYSSANKCYQTSSELPIITIMEICKRPTYQNIVTAQGAYRHVCSTYASIQSGQQFRSFVHERNTVVWSCVLNWDFVAA